jgi:hypothetical protein
MSRKIIILLVGLMLIPGLCFAEFYKYRDADGVLRFTDNLADVPRDQREKVQQYQETATPEPAEGPSETVPALSLNERADQLNSERNLLAEEYAALEKERASIETATRDPENAAEYEAYLDQVEAYNSRIKAYEEKRKLFQEKIDAFNEDAKNQ